MATLRNSLATSLCRQFFTLGVCVLGGNGHGAESVSTKAPHESRFERTVISRTLTDPMQFTLLPDGRIVVIEHMGKAHLIRRDGSMITTELPIYANSGSEDGLIGVAADPDFVHHPYLYCLHAVQGDKPKQHLTRYGFTGDRIDVASAKTILEIPNCRDPSGHCGGCLSFGPDRLLFISTGDNTSPFDVDGYSPLDPRSPGRDARATSANSNDLRGKILRIRVNTDGTYGIPEGNLFPPQAPMTRPEIYVMGCRNPFRHSVDPLTGFLFWGDIGPDAVRDDPRGPQGYDEFNVAQGPGFFGWPLFIGSSQPYANLNIATGVISGYFTAGNPRNDSPLNTGIKILPKPNDPLIWYPYAKTPMFSELGEGGRSAMSGPVYRTSKGIASANQFPNYYEGKWFIYDWMRNWIKVVSLDEHARLIGIEPFLPSTEFVRPIDMKFAADGTLYILEYGKEWSDNQDGQLSRIVFIPGNRTPICRVSADISSGKNPLTVRLSNQGTHDPDAGDTLTYSWNFGVSGATSSLENPSFTFIDPGSYVVTLTVRDQSGALSVASLPISVGNSKPVVTISKPDPGEFLNWNMPIPFAVDVRDAEDGPIDPSRIEVRAQYVEKDLPETVAAPDNREQHTEIFALPMFAQSDCLTCHRLKIPSLGPSFLAIAQRYYRQNACDALINKVIVGSTGVWGQVPMPPHTQSDPSRVRDQVMWILSLADNAQSLTGAQGVIPPFEQLGETPRGVVSITASYTDSGAKGQPALTGSSTMVMRPRTVKLADASQNKGCLFDPCADTDGGKNLGHIDHGDYVALAAINLAKTQAIQARISSAGPGGVIAVHMDSPDGRLLAMIPVAPTGGWQTWSTTPNVPIIDPGGSHTLFFVFKSSAGRGKNLFNVNWLHFVEKLTR